MGILYILRSLVNDRYYIGSTNNLERRLVEHNFGRLKYTQLTRPFKLVFSQRYESLSKARSIEYKLKRLKRRDIIDRIVVSKRILLGA